MVLGISGGISGSRITRSAVIAVKENTYFQAAEAIGSRKWRVLVRHALPNIAAPLIIIFTINIGGVGSPARVPSSVPRLDVGDQGLADQDRRSRVKADYTLFLNTATRLTPAPNCLLRRLNVRVQASRLELSWLFNDCPTRSRVAPCGLSQTDLAASASRRPLPPLSLGSSRSLTASPNMLRL